MAPIDDTYWVQRINGAMPVSGTSVTIGDVAPTTDQWNLAVVESVSRWISPLGDDVIEPPQCRVTGIDADGPVAVGADRLCHAVRTFR